MGVISMEGLWWWKRNHAGFFWLRGVCRNTKTEAISTHMLVYLQGRFAESIVVWWVVDYVEKQRDIFPVLWCLEANVLIVGEDCVVSKFQYTPSQLCLLYVDPPSWVCPGPTELLLTNKWLNWWDVTSEIRVRNDTGFHILGLHFSVTYLFVLMRVKAMLSSPMTENWGRPLVKTPQELHLSKMCRLGNRTLPVKYRGLQP